jgi:hypothetical protein
MAQRSAGLQVGIAHFGAQRHGGGEHHAGMFEGFVDRDVGAQGKQVAVCGAAAEGGFKG